MIIFILLLSACAIQGTPELILDTGSFTIKVPGDWEYKEEEGVDSFVGRIEGEDVVLFFDWSEMGYSNSLIPTKYEYMYEVRWNWLPVQLPYAQPEVTYTNGDVDALRAEIMREKGITDSSMVKVEKFQIPEININLGKDAFEAILIYKDTTIQHFVEFPEEIKSHQIVVDTLGNYERKIVRSTIEFSGITGVYFEDLNSSFNFNIVGENLSFENQDKAIEAFKTISLKR